MTTSTERSLVLVKPDGVRRGLTGEIVRRIEAKGYTLVRLELRTATRELLAAHYAEHEGKPFFGGLVDFITSGPIIAMAMEGNDAITLVRHTMGATSPLDSDAGTIRGDLAVEIGRNLVHGSDSPESADRELALFFTEDELLSYARDTDIWITGS